MAMGLQGRFKEIIKWYFDKNGIASILQRSQNQL